MNASRRFALAGLLVLVGAPPALAVRRAEDPLALVPSGAATVAVIRWNELRTSPLGAKVFAQMDEISTDGDAARFLHETGLSPREDVDTVIVAMSPGGRAGEADAGLVVFEGRFDVDRIASALGSRGATLQKADAGAFYRLAQKNTNGGRAEEPGAVALVNRHLIIAGSENAVVAALARKESGGAGGLTSGEGLGRHLSRIHVDASAWALVDVTRYPFAKNREAHLDVQVDSQGEPARAIFGAMKSVSLLALEAFVHGDAIEVSATGLSSDDETRGLLEDSLRGILAMWRLAAQEKSPDIVSVLRRFRIENDGEGVSIHGTLPGRLLRSFSAGRPTGR